MPTMQTGPTQTGTPGMGMDLPAVGAAAAAAAGAASPVNHPMPVSREKTPASRVSQGHARSMMEPARTTVAAALKRALRLDRGRKETTPRSRDEQSWTPHHCAATSEVEIPAAATEMHGVAVADAPSAIWNRAAARVPIGGAAPASALFPRPVVSASVAATRRARPSAVAIAREPMRHPHWHRGLQE